MINPRLGQTWSINDAVEVIVGWHDEQSHVHRTFILINDPNIHPPYNNLTQETVKEVTLAAAEKNPSSSNWVRIA